MSLLLATQITAIATSVLAFFAIVTAVFAFLAFLKQSREVRAIERQVIDQQELAQQQGELLRVQSGQLELQRQQLDDQRTERRRAQASRVFVWIRPDPEGGDPIDSAVVGVKNTSQQPIYDLILTWRIGSGERNEHLGPARTVLMPDEQYPFVAGITPGLPADSYLLATSLLWASVVFRDAAGVHWRLHSDGQLDEEPATE